MLWFFLLLSLAGALPAPLPSSPDAASVAAAHGGSTGSSAFAFMLTTDDGPLYGTVIHSMVADADVLGGGAAARLVRKICIVFSHILHVYYLPYALLRVFFFLLFLLYCCCFF